MNLLKYIIGSLRYDALEKELDNRIIEFTNELLTKLYRDNKKFLKYVYCYDIMISSYKTILIEINSHDNINDSLNLEIGTDGYSFIYSIDGYEKDVEATINIDDVYEDIKYHPQNGSLLCRCVKSAIYSL